jgi:hypothetical protein
MVLYNDFEFNLFLFITFLFVIILLLLYYVDIENKKLSTNNNKLK